jgi:uncharacterized protein YjbI with pentapeptide repeats
MDEQQDNSTNEAGPDDREPTPERQAELRQAYDANVRVGKAPYAGVVIGTRGELNWIVSERRWQASGWLDSLSDAADLRYTRISADMRNSVLDYANLSNTVIWQSNFTGASLVRVNLSGAVIIATDFTGARLVLTNWSDAAISDANFTGAQLLSASLSSAFISADFSRADLRGSILVGADIAGKFAGADFTRARMDATTILGDSSEEEKVSFDATTRLLDVGWNGAILALVNWDEVPRLGDEAGIKAARTRKERVGAYLDAARAYHGLTKALEAQGLMSSALRYRRRQHQLERAAQLRSFNLPGWIFSTALNIVSGYGDRPLRALGVYLAVILAFAGIYFGVTTPGSPIFFTGSQPLQLHEAVVFSLSSFHGRGFFPSTIGLGDPVAIVAALEAVVGLFIELVLIATFTRRLFER